MNVFDISAFHFPHPISACLRDLISQGIFFSSLSSDHRQILITVLYLYNIWQFFASKKKHPIFLQIQFYVCLEQCLHFHSCHWIISFCQWPWNTFLSFPSTSDLSCHGKNVEIIFLISTLDGNVYLWLIRSNVPNPKAKSQYLILFKGSF